MFILKNYMLNKWSYLLKTEHLYFTSTKASNIIKRHFLERCPCLMILTMKIILLPKVHSAASSQWNKQMESTDNLITNTDAIKIYN